MLTKKIKSDNNFKIEKKNKLAFKGCDSTLFNYVSMRVYQDDGKSKDSLDYESVNYHQWKDSILLVFRIPAEYAKGKLSYKFTYHLSCKEKLRGTETNFSVNNDDNEGKDIIFTFRSEPAGARVYLVPKFFWDKNFASKKKPINIADIEDFIIPADLTPVSVIVEEYVYYAVYELNGVIKKIKIAPTKKKLSDSVFIDLKKVE